MKSSNNSVLGRLGGPAGSVLLHVAVAIVLLKVLVFRAPKREQAIEVRVVERPVRPVDQPEPEKAPPKEEERLLEEPADLIDSLPQEQVAEDAMPEPDLSGLDAVAKVESPLVLTGVMAGRSVGGRRKMLRRFGGKYGGEAEKAVVRGLDWLQGAQCENGSWGVGRSRSMTARQERARLTGLALLAFLAHGETPSSIQYGETVQRAIRYLLDEQDPKTGRFCPFSKTVGSHDDIGVYGHAIATYALAEAYGLTRAPLLRTPVERGVQVILDGQQAGGGWDHRYQHEKWSDLSVTGWQVQALRAAQVARINLPGLDAALQKSVPFVQSMHDEAGAFFYRTGNKKPSGGLDYMTGVAVLCMQLAGSNRVDEVRAGLGFLKDRQCTDWDEGWRKTGKNKSFNIAYEWYYNTQAIFQKGGSKWSTWNSRFAPMLIRAQDASGAWKPPSEADEEISKDIVYTTDFCILSLEVYYRILPSFQKVEKAAAPFVFDGDVKIEVL